jgi:hypothetical protein
MVRVQGLKSRFNYSAIAYLAWSSIQTKSHSAEEVKLLLLKKTPFEDKKRILFQLAHTPILSAHNAITRYLKDNDDDLLPWAIIAWRESHELILEAGMRKIFGDNFEAEPLIMLVLEVIKKDACDTVLCSVENFEPNSQAPKYQKLKMCL